MASPIHTAGLVGRKRTCPKCGHRQMVPFILHHETVTCRRCGSQIPPLATPPVSDTSASSTRKRRT